MPLYSGSSGISVGAWDERWQVLGSSPRHKNLKGVLVAVARTLSEHYWVQDTAMSQHLIQGCPAVALVGTISKGTYWRCQEKKYLLIHLLLEFVQSWQTFRHTIMTEIIRLLADVTIKQKMPHKLLPVIHIQVAIALQEVSKLAAWCHGIFYTPHEELTHVSKICHVLHVGLCAHVVYWWDKLHFGKLKI